MNKDIERGEHTLCSRSSKCLLLHCNGIFLGSGNIPQTTRDRTWPQSTQENIGQEGLRTGQRQAFCFSYSCGNSPCSTAVYTAAQCFFSSLPQVTALVQAMESHTGQVKESPQAQKLHALLEPKTLVPTTCIASSVLIERTCSITRVTKLKSKVWFISRYLEFLPIQMEFTSQRSF